MSAKGFYLFAAFLGGCGSLRLNIRTALVFSLLIDELKLSCYGLVQRLLGLVLEAYALGLVVQPL